MSVPAPKVRKAKQFLRKHAKAGTRDISPRKFAAAAAEQKSSLGAVLNLIRYYYASGDERAQMRRSQINRGE